MSVLNDNEKQVIYMKYYMDYSQLSIGKMLGVSQAQISRIEHKALSKMKYFLECGEVQVQDKREKRSYEYQGNKYTLRELNILSGIPMSTIKARIDRGLTVEESLINEDRRLA